MLVVADDPSQVENQLRAEALGCAGCDGPLGPWGWASLRWIRTLHGMIRLRPRRARCRCCQSTHVLLPSSVLVRRLNAVEVIRAALAAKAQGRGRRTIFAQLGVALSTVRNWLRRAEANAEQIRKRATSWAVQLSADPRAFQPQGCQFADAFHALTIAARACAVQLGSPACSWHLLASLTNGQLLAPRLNSATGPSKPTTF